MLGCVGCMELYRLDALEQVDRGRARNKKRKYNKLGLSCAKLRIVELKIGVRNMKGKKNIDGKL